MTHRRKIGAALAILALAILPAAAFATHHVVQLLSVLVLVGGSTVVYQSFQTGFSQNAGYTGGATAPTQEQSATVQAVVATVQFSDTDTIATFTHNFGLSAAAAAALAPYIQWYALLFAATTNTYPLLTFALTNTNVITINKISNTGTGSTIVVIVRRPWSASQ